MNHIKKNSVLVATTIGFALSLQACGNLAFIPKAGPSASQVTQNAANVTVVSVDANNFTDLSYITPKNDNLTPFSQQKPKLYLGKGDAIQISMWEAPPAVLFGTSTSDSSDSIGISGGVLNLPEQYISEKGYIVVPFVGQVSAAGRTLNDVEAIIRSRLAKIANSPQIIARLTQNNSNRVTVISDGKSYTLPLTAKGERITDVISSTGEIKKLKDTTISLTRSNQTTIIRANQIDQQSLNNFYLYPNDTVKIIQAPYTVSVLGASNTNSMINFGDGGLSVAEAIAKSSGLNDFRANPKGVYIFRQQSNLNIKPVVYQLNMNSTEGIFLAQNVQLRDKDILYISNASGSELQKFLSIIGAIINPIASAKILNN